MALFAAALLVATACTSESHVSDNRPMPVGTIPPTPTATVRVIAEPPAPWPHLDLALSLAPVAVEPLPAATQAAQPTGAVVAASYDPPQPPSGRLTADEAIAVLIAAGWPAERHAEALSVACGIGNERWPNGESGCNPSASNGQYKGLFQLGTPFWFNYCGIDPALWADAVANARCALAVFMYDIGRGSPPWQQWEVKP